MSNAMEEELALSARVLTEPRARPAGPKHAMAVDSNSDHPGRIPGKVSELAGGGNALLKSQAEKSIF